MLLCYAIQTSSADLKTTWWKIFTKQCCSRKKNRRLAAAGAVAGSAAAAGRGVGVVLRSSDLERLLCSWQIE